MKNLLILVVCAFVVCGCDTPSPYIGEKYPADPGTNAWICVTNQNGVITNYPVHFGK